MEEFLQRLAEELAPRIKAEIERSSVWVSQKESMLGRNRHCRAVKRRLAEGLEGAAIVGRQCLLTPAALREEMQRLMMPMQPPVAGSPLDKQSDSTVVDEEQAAFEAALASVRRSRGA